jgi:hypothetical protein
MRTSHNHAPAPLDPRLYSANQVLAAEGKLPLDHPSWRDPHWADRLQTADPAVEPDDDWMDLDDLVDEFTDLDDDVRVQTCCFAHCASCGRHFGGVGAFDAHWIGRGDNRRCVDPRTLKKPLDARRDEAGRTVWSRPYAGTQGESVA